MRQLSKLLLLVQAPFLAYLTLLGHLLCTGAIFEDLSGAVVGVIILSAVLAGWRIWFWVMADGPAEHKSIHRGWWLFASMGRFIRCGGTLPDGRTFQDLVRATFCLRKVNDSWVVEHQHVSKPYEHS